MAKEPEAEAGGEAGAAPKKGKKKLILIVVGLLVVVLAAGVPMVLLKGGGDKEAENVEEHKEEPPKLKLAELGVFIVNLSETSSFLKVDIKIEYDAGLLEKLSAEGGEGGGEGHGGGYSGGGEEAGGGGLPPKLKDREPVIRDAIIRVLSSRKTEDVLSVDGKDALKEEIIEALNDATGLEQPIVTNVYFSEFIVQ